MLVALIAERELFSIDVNIAKKATNIVKVIGNLT